MPPTRHGRMNYPSHELAKVLARVHQRQPNACFDPARKQQLEIVGTPHPKSGVTVSWVSKFQVGKKKVSMPFAILLPPPQKNDRLTSSSALRPPPSLRTAFAFPGHPGSTAAMADPTKAVPRDMARDNPSAPNHDNAPWIQETRMKVETFIQELRMLVVLLPTQLKNMLVTLDYFPREG